MAATLRARAKEVYDDGTIIEVVVWDLPAPVLPCAHSHKYRVFYGTASGERVR